MQLSNEIRLLLLVAAAFLIGIIVLILNPDYRFKVNLESNKDYYSDIVDAEITPGIDDNAVQQDFEF